MDTLTNNGDAIIIHKSFNYDQFSILYYNREVNQNHVNKLMQSIKKNGYDPNNQIKCNPDLSIYDGTHRFYACKILELPIYYSVSDKPVTADMVIALNNTSRDWEFGDFNGSFVKQGKKSYFEMTQFCEKHIISLTACIDLVFFDKISLSVESTRRKAKVIAKSGEMNISTETFEKAEKLLNRIKDFSRFTPSWKSSRFILSALTLFQHPLYDHKKMLNCLNNFPYPFVPMNSNYKNLIQFENIYNYKELKKDHIKFTERVRNNRNKQEISFNTIFREY